MADRIEATLQHVEGLIPTWHATPLKRVDGPSNSYTDGSRPITLMAVPRSSGLLLEAMVIVLNARNILELGCSGGYSTIFMARAARVTGGHITTTEILPEKIELARSHFKMAGVEDVITILEGDIHETLGKSVTAPLDFVFLDADKESYPDYFRSVVPMLRSGGVIVADNMDMAERVKPFTDAVQADGRVTSHMLPLDNHLMLIRKL